MTDFNKSQEYQGFFKDINTQNQNLKEDSEALSYKDFVEELKRAKNNLSTHSTQDNQQYDATQVGRKRPNVLQIFDLEKTIPKNTQEEQRSSQDRNISDYILRQHTSNNTPKQPEVTNELILQELKKNNELLVSIAKAIQEITKIPQTLNTNSDNIITEVSEHNYYVNKLISKVDQLTQNIASQWIQTDIPKSHE
jgi:hypothetical protein